MNHVSNQTGIMNKRVYRTVQQPVSFLFLVHQILSPLGHQHLQMFTVLLHLKHRESYLRIKMSCHFKNSSYDTIQYRQLSHYEMRAHVGEENKPE